MAKHRNEGNFAWFVAGVTVGIAGAILFAPKSGKETRQQLAEAASTIVEELNVVQGQPMDVGGYYVLDAELASRAMRPSTTFNAILARIT